jgi:hypothetical protein
MTFPPRRVRVCSMDLVPKLKGRLKLTNIPLFFATCCIQTFSGVARILLQGGHENSSLFFLNRLMSLLYLYLYYNNLVTITNLQTKFQSLSNSH